MKLISNQFDRVDTSELNKDDDEWLVGWLNRNRLNGWVRKYHQK